jgi:hypothetical protein
VERGAIEATMRDDTGHGTQVENNPDAIHKYKHNGIQMPWHSDDKPFGWTQEDWMVAKTLNAATRFSWCHCGLPGEYNMGHRWYCQECWEIE